ncbi:YcnI family protein [Paenibacillus sp. M1]|uniref:YcnI family protein n=1 Tax=Paenibacillus haidiansis TaxID=1574488 RepID=A0ABU7VRK2_9BACL
MMRKFISRMTAFCSAAAAGLLLFGGIASAHVTVNPGASAPGAWETYSIKIPVEKDIPTVKVSLKMPEGLDFKQYRPVPDWKVELTKDDSGRVTVVTWSSEGDGIGPGEFQQFEFVAKNPDAEAALAWDAFQYYSDGSIVEWSGEEGSATPHSITEVSADAAAGAEGAGAAGHDAGQGHDTDAGNGSATAPDTGASDGAGTGADGGGAADAAGDQAASGAAAGEAENADGGGSAVGTAALVVSIAALLVSLAALWSAIRSKRRAS